MPSHCKHDWIDTTEAWAGATTQRLDTPPQPMRTCTKCLRSETIPEGPKAPEEK